MRNGVPEYIAHHATRCASGNGSPMKRATSLREGTVAGWIANLEEKVSSARAHLLSFDRTFDRTSRHEFELRLEAHDLPQVVGVVGSPGASRAVGRARASASSEPPRQH